VIDVYIWKLNHALYYFSSCLLAVFFNNILSCVNVIFLTYVQISLKWTFTTGKQEFFRKHTTTTFNSLEIKHHVFEVDWTIKLYRSPFILLWGNLIQNLP
jgi:hypothetical protein